MNVQIPVKWLQELLALCGPEDHELRERVMVSITAMDEQAARAVARPEHDEAVNEVMELVSEYTKNVLLYYGFSVTGATKESATSSWDDIETKLRALLATATGLPAQAVPYSLDLDPLGIRALAASAITGALSFGATGGEKPPAGHWLEWFYQAGAEKAPQAQAFQQRVQPWMMACFGPEISADSRERNHRFLEEALELVQSCGCTASEAHQLVDYVYGRPWGEPAQEAGGVMVTLAALCLANGLDMHACGETELARIWTKVEAIRAKQAAKPKHSPLPMQAHQTQDALRLAFVLSEIRREGMDALTAALHDPDGFPLDHQASVEAIDRAAIAAAKGE